MISAGRIVAMEWAFWAFVVVMLGLYVWSHVTAGHAISKKLQPFVDDLFGVDQKSRQKPRDEDHG
jgi:hypothetical protein